MHVSAAAEGRSGKEENNNKKIDRQAATTCVRNTVTKIFF